MPIHYEYDENLNVVHSHLTGTVQVEDLETFVRSLLADKALREGFIEVAHLEDMQHYKFAFSKAINLAPFFNRLIKERGYAGSIFIVKSQYQYGMTRMFSSIGENTGLNLRIARKDEDVPSLLEQMRDPEQPDESPGDLWAAAF